jgi:para-aminobenzoate synthetase component I
MRISRLNPSLAPADLFPSLACDAGAVFLDTALLMDGGDAFSILAGAPSQVLIDDLPEPAATPPCPIQAGDPPFQAGWIGFLAYESASLWNRDLTTLAPEPGLPRAWWGRYEASLAFRHADGAWFLSQSDGGEGDEAASRLQEMLRRHRPAAPPAYHTSDRTSGMDVSEHGHRVGEIQRWIERGHIYQANLTYRVSARLTGSPVGLYMALRTHNPAPFAAYLAPRDPHAAGSWTIQSSSPELLLRVRGREVTTRPIKGTRPRGSDPRLDRGLAEELLGSAKDRAELTMIVDLERNDLGRVCRTGSVNVGPFPRVETYQTVHHLVAEVKGTLADGVSWRDLIHATFPGGSVTGAPKIRAMEILRELESAPRFVYTGALGYLDDGGDSELALTIRTLWTVGGQVHFGVGGGIVIDSDPTSEWDETLHKAQGLVAALEP